MFQNIPDYLAAISNKYANRYSLYIRRFLRTTRFTFKEVGELSIKIASYLLDLGLKPGDCVLIWAPNMPEWVLTLFGSLSAGIVVVPVGLHSTKEVVEKYIKQTKPKVLFLSKYFPVDISSGSDKSVKKIYLEDILTLVRNVEPKSLPKVGKNALAEIVFTSGTTGEPKGVMISHHNILYEIEQLMKTVPRYRHYRMLSILPLSHVMEQVVGLIGPLARGATIYYTPRINTVAIKKALAKYRITDLGVVPQMLRMFLDSIELQVKQTDSKLLFDVVIKIAPVLPIFLRRALFSKIHDTLGGKLYVFGVGSAPLDVKLAQAWEAMGIKVVEGYGASETTGGVTVNRIDKRKLGSVGKKMSGMEISFSPEKEILVKGDNVTKGYFENDEKTKDSFTSDGFFKTGDVGYFDKGGWLYITGREKFKIVTAAGDKIYPEDVERKLNANHNVWDSCVMGVKKNDGEIVFASLILKPEAKVGIETVIKNVNSALEPNQQILEYSLWSEKDFPRLHTLKVDRNKIKDFIENQRNGIKMETPQTGVPQDKLIEILAEVCKISPDKIKEGSILTTDLGMDSLKRVELVSLLEEESGTEIDEIAIGKDATVHSVRKLYGLEIVPEPEKYDLEKIRKYITNPFRRALKVILQNFLVFPIFKIIIRTELFSETDFSKLKPPFMLVGNHLDPGDAVSLLSRLPGNIRNRLLIPADDEHWKGNYVVPYLLKDGEFIQMFGGGFPLNKHGGAVGKSLETLVDFLEDGYPLLFFPEGQYTTPKGTDLGELKKGIVMLVKGTEIPIIPFYVSGDLYKTFPLRTLDKGAFEHFRPRGFSHVVIRIGKAFTVTDQTDDEIMKRLSEEILKLSKPI